MNNNQDFPQCPDTLPSDISVAIKRIGSLWRKSKHYPKISKKVSKRWDDLLKSWADDPKIPIIIRKSGSARGSELKHNSGRKIILADNSPAQWACFLALKKVTPNIGDIKKWLKNDQLPISFATKKSEKDLIKYKCTLKNYSINKYGWKLCHIKPVGLKTQRDITEVKIEDLTDKFLKLMSPSNFFLLPKQWGGLGESPEFIEQMIQ